MSSTNLTITAPQLPEGYCISNLQDFVNLAVGGALVNFDTSGLTGVLKQNTTPTYTQRGLIWYNTDTGHTLVYDNPTGAWVMRHPIPPGGGAGMLWFGTLIGIDTYDGGSSSTVGNASGPMWEVVPELAGRFPIGVGNLPDTVNGTVSIVVGASGGHNELVMVKDNLPADTVDVKTAVIGQSGVTGGGPNPVVGSTYGSDAITGTSAACDATSTLVSGAYYSRGQTLPLGIATPLNTINPYYGIFFIRRTNRIYYTS
jgi:hypothetical protein